MSKATVLPATKSSGSVTNLAEIGTRFVTLALDSASEFIKQSSAFFVSATPVSQVSRSLGCCDIPQTDCPPHCVCEVNWEASRGETLKLVLQVINRSTEERDFVFRAMPFLSGEKELAEIQVSPANALLAPGRSIAVTAELLVSDAFEPGTTYETEVLLDGVYEQCVCIRLQVEPEQVSHCTVEQGDPPVRVRSHEWYSHFQCSEPCVPVRVSRAFIPTDDLTFGRREDL